MNLETKITIYKFTPQVFTLTLNLHLLTPHCLEKQMNIEIQKNRLPLLHGYQ